MIEMYVAPAEVSIRGTEGCESAKRWTRQTRWGRFARGGRRPRNGRAPASKSKPTDVALGVERLWLLLGERFEEFLSSVIHFLLR